MKIDSIADVQRMLGIGRLFDTIQDAVIVAEAHSERIVLWNDSAARLFGYSTDEALDLPLENIVPERIRAKHRSGLATYRTTGHGEIIEGDRPVELPALRRDGTEFHVELSLSPIPNVEAPGVFVLAIVRDITERKQLEATKDNFIANAAHELRTPVTAVLGSADLISRWRQLPEDLMEECVSTLGRQTQRLSTLVRSMLDLSRLQRKRSELKLTSVELDDVARNVLESNPPPQGKRLESSIGSGFCVMADPERLDQIITNLLINSYIYGGPLVTVSSGGSDDSVRLTISDDGDGVPAELVPQLFEPFSRGENSVGIQGSGLGLTIVRMLAEAMGGEVWYEGSEPGACFSIQFPRV